MYASVKWVSIGSDNGLAPVWRQDITWTNADLLSIKPLGTYLSEIWIKIQSFSLMKMYLKCHLRNGSHFVLGEMSQYSLFCLQYCSCSYRILWHAGGWTILPTCYKIFRNCAGKILETRTLTCMASCKTAATPLLLHWCSCSLALSHCHNWFLIQGSSQRSRWSYLIKAGQGINTLKPEWNCLHEESICILIWISVKKFYNKGSFHSTSALYSSNGLLPVQCQVIAWLNENWLIYMWYASLGLSELMLELMWHFNRFHRLLQFFVITLRNLGLQTPNTEKLISNLHPSDFFFMIKLQMLSKQYEIISKCILFFSVIS